MQDITTTVHALYDGVIEELEEDPQKRKLLFALNDEGVYDTSHHSYGDLEKRIAIIFEPYLQQIETREYPVIVDERTFEGHEQLRKEALEILGDRIVNQYGDLGEYSMEPEEFEEVRGSRPPGGEY